MLPKMCCGLAVAFFVLGSTHAGETIDQAMVKAIDYERHSITVTVGDKDHSYAIHKDAKILVISVVSKGDPLEFPGEVTAIEAGSTVHLSVTKIGSKDFVTTVKVEPLFFDLPAKQIQKRFVPNFKKPKFAS